MVGEIRDSETARVAIHTALTGHLVLSTLHTNSALEAIPRLVDMGIDHYLLASTLRLVVAQRLVRTVCRECYGLGSDPGQRSREILDRHTYDDTVQVSVQSESCSTCRSSGYAGRSVIAEVCEVDAGLKEIIASKGSLKTCLSHAFSHGFHPMSEDGMEKVEWGVTTREELLRVMNT